MKVETMAAEKRSAEASVDSKNDSIKTLESTVADLRMELEKRLAIADLKPMVKETYQESSQDDSRVEELRKKVQLIVNNSNVFSL